MAQFPALPLWTDAYIADCSHLSFAEHGIYLNLLMLMWRTPNCRIPNEDEWISRKLKCDADAMRTHVRPLMQEFCETDGNWIIQKRLQKEWRWCMDKREKNRDSANSRWSKDKIISEGIANGDANAMPPTHTLSIPTNKILNGHAEQFEAFWSSYPRREAKGAAIKAYLKALDKTSPEMLLGCAAAYASKTDGTEKKFIKMAATWLNQECWQDEGISPETAPNPEEIEANKDRADKLFHRGKYSIRYE